MKKEIDKYTATRLINSGMLILVTAAYKDKTTITPVAWYMPISKKPPSLGIALTGNRFSLELIRKSEAFIINIPQWSLLDDVVMCGSVSGREVNKFEKCKLTQDKSHSLINVPKIKECAGSIECSLVNLKEIGDHYLCIGEVIYAEAQEDYFQNDIWNTNKVEFIFHLGSRFFFKSSPYVEI